MPRTVLGTVDLGIARVDRVWGASEVPTQHPHLVCVWVLTGQCLHSILASAMQAANSDAPPR